MFKRNTAPARKVVLVVSDRDLHSFKGNNQRIVSLLVALKELGCFVLLVGPRTLNVDLARTLCDDMLVVDAAGFAGGRILDFDYHKFAAGVSSMAKKRNIEIAIAEYAWMAKCLLRTAPTCLRVVDTHDLLHERFDYFASIGSDPWAECSWDDERELLQHADMVLAIQESEAARLKSLFNGAKAVVCIPHGVTLSSSFKYEKSQGDVLLFLGSRHAGNLGVKDFLSYCWPEIRATITNVQLLVCGSICDVLEPQQGLTLMGVTKDLTKPYMESALTICPIVGGSGLKIKLVESLMYGRSVVATPAAIAGMPIQTPEPWELACTWPEFTAVTIKLLLDHDHRHRLEQYAQEYAQEFYSMESLKRALLTMFEMSSDKPRDLIEVQRSLMPSRLTV